MTAKTRLKIFKLSILFFFGFLTLSFAVHKKLFDGIDIISMARQCIGSSQYRRGARPSEAPALVDCSSFTKWLYAQRGIWLPRRSIQQSQTGETINLDELADGDLIFTSGPISYYYDDPADGVGHVGIATGDGSVIHAANTRVNVIESPLKKFVDPNNLRKVKRLVPKNLNVLTLETPLHREVETSDDIRWIILQSLPYP